MKPSLIVPYEPCKRRGEGSGSPNKCPDFEKHLEEQETLLLKAETIFRYYLHEDEEDINGLALDFTSFYAAYLQPYIGCFACPRTHFVIDAIDLDKDGSVQWAFVLATKLASSLSFGSRHSCAFSGYTK